MILRACVLASLAAVTSAHGAQAEMVSHSRPFTTFKVMADRLEARLPDEGDEGWLWDAQAWWGGDINKLWLESEGEAEDGDLHEADLQVLYSRAITSFFDVQAGVRQDFEPDGKTYAVLGLQGLAPQWFEIDAHGFLSTDGDVTADFEAEYDLLLTQRWVLQPRAEVSVALQDVEDRGLASGFTHAEFGVRLRYEIRREFAPYVGVEWTSALGDTRDLVRAAGGAEDDIVFVLGVRAWF